MPQSAKEVERRLSLALTEKAKRSLQEYTRQAWHVVEPATPFVWGWHLGAISEHLEAVTNGEIKNLLINIPPRHSKSLQVSVFWPTWEWIKKPWIRYIYSAYGQDLSTRDALKSRRLIQSPWYQRHFGDSFQLTGDQNQKTRYENDRTGYRLATGVGGLATGEGGDRLVLDDPHKLADAHSDTALLNAVTFWNETMSTRGNDPETVAKVVIMQRVHEADVTGDILEKMEAGGEQYETLILPAEYEPKRSYVFKGDPREEEGELLWPERFDRRSIETLKVSLGEQASGQLQQRPSPAGGAIFKEEWWDTDLYPDRRYDPADRAMVNRIKHTWVAWDTANKKEDRNAFTAGVVGSLLPNYQLMIRYAVMARKDFSELEDFVTSESHPFNADLKLHSILIEDMASGQALIPVLRKRGEPWLRKKIVAVPAPPTLSKEAKWEAASDWCRQGCIILPHPTDDAPWLHDLEDPLFKVPAAKFVDVVDAFSILINHVEEKHKVFSKRVRMLRAHRGEYDLDMARMAG